MSMPNTAKLVSMDFEMVVAMMAKFSKEWEDGALPSEHQVGLSYGTDAGITYEFRKQVGQTATFLSGSLVEIETILSTSRDKILEAVNDLADKDASMADEAAIIREALGTVAPVSTTRSTTTGAASNPSVR